MTITEALNIADSGDLSPDDPLIVLALRVRELEDALEELRDRTSCTQSQYEIIDRSIPRLTP